MAADTSVYRNRQTNSLSHQVTIATTVKSGFTALGESFHVSMQSLCDFSWILVKITL